MVWPLNNETSALKLSCITRLLWNFNTTYAQNKYLIMSKVSVSIDTPCPNNQHLSVCQRNYCGYKLKHLAIDTRARYSISTHLIFDNINAFLVVSSRLLADKVESSRMSNVSSRFLTRKISGPSKCLRLASWSKNWVKHLRFLIIPLSGFRI